MYLRWENKIKPKAKKQNKSTKTNKQTKTHNKKPIEQDHELHVLKPFKACRRVIQKTRDAIEFQSLRMFRAV